MLLSQPTRAAPSPGGHDPCCAAATAQSRLHTTARPAARAHLGPGSPAHHIPTASGAAQHDARPPLDIGCAFETQCRIAATVGSLQANRLARKCQVTHDLRRTSPSSGTIATGRAQTRQLTGGLAHIWQLRRRITHEALRLQRVPSSARQGRQHEPHARRQGSDTPPLPLLLLCHRREPRRHPCQALVDCSMRRTSGIDHWMACVKQCSLSCGPTRSLRDPADTACDTAMKRGFIVDP
jgi:hypothetical protein